MGTTEDLWGQGMTRRGAITRLAAFLAGSPFLRAQQDPFPLGEHRRIPGLDEMRNVWDFEAVFDANETLVARDYTAHGDGTEWTVRRNRAAFEWVEIAPGKPVDPASVDLSTRIYRTEMAFPLMIAPTANHRQIHPEGEAATRRGAAAAGTPYIVAHSPSVPLREVSAAGRGPIWYQLYGYRKLEDNRPWLDLAQEAGCEAVVVTVDQQASHYPRTLQDRNARGFPAALGVSPGATGPERYGVEPGRLWYTWRWLDEVRKFVRVPVLVKGILTAEDARLCAERGLGIIVSNHGGRSLDYDPSTLEVLPEIVAVVGGRVPVLMDSGIRRGSDIFKALALGANAVCVGRPQRWGLGAFGAAGVEGVMSVLQAELLQAAAAAGRTSLASIDRSAVKARFP